MLPEEWAIWSTVILRYLKIDRHDPNTTYLIVKHIVLIGNTYIVGTTHMTWQAETR